MLRMSPKYFGFSRRELQLLMSAGIAIQKRGHSLGRSWRVWNLLFPTRGGLVGDLMVKSPLGAQQSQNCESLGFLEN